MEKELFNQEKVLSPSYWDGHDVLSNTPPLVVANETVALEHKLYSQTKAALEAGARALYSGNSQEVSYLGGTHFNPTPDQLADGSIVIAEYEGLIRNISPVEPIDLPESDNIRLPLVDYWREHLATLNCGVDRTLIPDHNAFFNRVLMWGVLATGPNQTRALQTFSFRSLIPTDDGSFKYTDDMQPALLLPLEPGGVSVGNAKADGIHRLVIHRMQGLHVVYLADSEKKGHRVKKRQLIPELGRILVPHVLSEAA